MPSLLNRRGIGVLLWPDGEMAVFATFDDAVSALNQITWALDMNTLILEAY